MEENQPTEKRGPGNPAWVKGGESPNPLGRGVTESTGYQDTKTRFKYLATKYTFEELIALALDSKAWGKLPVFDAIILKTLHESAQGHEEFIKISLERILGKAVTPLEVTGSGGKDFSFDGKIIIEHVPVKKSDDDEKLS